MTSIATTSLAGFPALRTASANDRPPLMFVHGAFATHQPFAPWMAALERAGWGGIAVARRGALGGGTATSVAGLRIADYVEDTVKAIDALGEAPVIVGHSLGGLIAQKIAELGKCRAAVLVASAPPGMLTPQPRSLPALLPMMPRILLGLPLRPGRATCEAIVLNCVPVAARARIYDGLVPESGKVYREMIFGTFRVDAGPVRCPVLVVGGGQDRIVSEALNRSTAKRYGAACRLYANHGHWLLEEPGFESVVGDVAAWLDQVLPRNAMASRAG